MNQHINIERESEKEGYLVASVDVNGSSPELKGALPRPEMGGQLVMTIVEISRRQRKHS